MTGTITSARPTSLSKVYPIAIEHTTHVTSATSLRPTGNQS